MRAFEIIRSPLIERIVGNTAVVFHRTHHIDTVENITQDGFQAGHGDAYGVGIYATYAFESQLSDYMRRHYGPYILRARVQLHGMVICDYDTAKRVYGDRYRLVDQVRHLGLRLRHPDASAAVRANLKARRGKGLSAAQLLAEKIKNWSEELESIEFSSDVAKELYPYLKDATGLVYTGRNDGRCIVVYEPSKVTPLAYTYDDPDERGTKTEEKDFEWTKLDIGPLVKKTMGTAPPPEDDDHGFGDDDRPMLRGTADQIEASKKALERNRLKIATKNPDAILQWKDTQLDDRIVDVALAKKPRLVLSLAFGQQPYQSFYRVFDKNQELLGEYLSSEGWAATNTNDKWIFLAHYLRTKMPEKVPAIILRDRLPIGFSSEYAETIFAEDPALFKAYAETGLLREGDRASTMLYRLSSKVRDRQIFAGYVRAAVVNRGEGRAATSVLEYALQNTPEVFDDAVKAGVKPDERVQLLIASPERYLPIFGTNDDEILAAMQNLGRRSDRWYPAVAAYLPIDKIDDATWTGIRRTLLYGNSSDERKLLSSLRVENAEQMVRMAKIWEGSFCRMLAGRIKDGEVSLPPKAVMAIEAVLPDHVSLVGELINHVPVPPEVQRFAVRKNPSLWAHPNYKKLLAPEIQAEMERPG